MRALAAVGIALLAGLLAACGGGGQQDAEGGAFPPGQVVKRAERLGPNPVVRGRAFPITDDALVLAGKQHGVVVTAPEAAVKAIRKQGMRVIASGQVRRLTERQAREFSAGVARVARQRAQGDRPPPQGLVKASVKPRDPYIAAERLQPAQKR
jgi:hypothetical protein